MSSNPYIDSDGCTAQGSCPLSISQVFPTGNATSSVSSHDPNSILLVADLRIHTLEFYYELQYWLELHDTVVIYWIGQNNRVHPNKQVDMLQKALLHEWVQKGTINSYKGIVWCAFRESTQEFAKVKLKTSPTLAARMVAQDTRDAYLYHKHLQTICNSVPVIILDSYDLRRYESALGAVTSLPVRLDYILTVMIDQCREEIDQEHRRFQQAPHINIKRLHEGVRVPSHMPKASGNKKRDGQQPLHCLTLIYEGHHLVTNYAKLLFKKKFKNYATTINILTSFSQLDAQAKRNPIIVIALNRDSPLVTQLAIHNEEGNKRKKWDRLYKYFSAWEAPNDTNSKWHPTSYDTHKNRLHYTEAAWAQEIALNPSRNSTGRLIILEWLDRRDGSQNAFHRQQDRLGPAFIYEHIAHPGPTITMNMVKLASEITGLFSTGVLLYRDDTHIYTTMTKEERAALVKQYPQLTDIPPVQSNFGKFCGVIIAGAIGELGFDAIAGAEMVTVGADAFEGMEGMSEAFDAIESGGDLMGDAMGEGGEDSLFEDGCLA